MAAVCATCGLPDDRCVCEDIAEEQELVKVRNDKRRYGKLVTVAEGFDGSDVDLPELAKALKNKCAADGAARAGRIELQGEHRKKVAEVLKGLGYRVEVV